MDSVGSLKFGNDLTILTYLKHSYQIIIGQCRLWAEYPTHSILLGGLGDCWPPGLFEGESETSSVTLSPHSLAHAEFLKIHLKCSSLRNVPQQHCLTDRLSGSRKTDNWSDPSMRIYWHQSGRRLLLHGWFMMQGRVHVSKMHKPHGSPDSFKNCSASPNLTRNLGSQGSMVKIWWDEHVSRLQNASDILHIVSQWTHLPREAMWRGGGGPGASDCGTRGGVLGGACKGAVRQREGPRADRVGTGWTFWTCGASSSRPKANEDDSYSEYSASSVSGVVLILLLARVFSVLKTFGADAATAWLPTVPPVSESQAPGATVAAASGSGGGGGIDKPGGPEDTKPISLPKVPGSSKSK